MFHNLEFGEQFSVVGRCPLITLSELFRSSERIAFLTA
jgi:hypothetical protein